MATKKYVSPDNVGRLWTKAKERFQAKESGKGLSTNDYTAAEKEKLAGLNKITVDSALSDSSLNPLQNKIVKAELDKKLNASEKGASGGVAELGLDGKIPVSQLPSYVDDVIDAYGRTDTEAETEVFNLYADEAFGTKLTPESGKIYVDVLSNKTYRWSGSVWAQIGGGSGVALGETAQTAYRGDRGKIAYDHSQAEHAPADAEKNVQPDWSTTDQNSDAFIKNKPAVFRASTETAAGTQGFVPAPAAGTELRLLASDGTWLSPMTTAELDALLQ